MTHRRIGPIVIGGLVVLAVVAAIFFTVRKPAIPVDLGRVSRGPMAMTIDDEAETRAHDVYVVSAPINGRLLRLALEPGDRLNAGQSIIARMMPAEPDFLDERRLGEARARVRSLEAMAASTAARISEARAERDLAHREFDRNQSVFQRGFLSQAAIDRVRMTRDRADAFVIETQRAAEATQFDLAAARATLTSPSGRNAATSQVFTVVAPVSGWVLRVPQKSEATVPAGTPLVEIGDPKGLELVTDLLSTDAVKIKPGAKAMLEQWGGNRPIEARVRLVEPYGFTKISALGVEEQRVNVILDFVGPPGDRAGLGHGYRGIIRIVTWSSPDVLTVPASALFRSGNDWAIFVVENRRARLTRASIGAINPDQAELLTKILEGSKVILHPGDRVVDGVRVQARPE
jgi:HlyD family secretion protein